MQQPTENPSGSGEPLADRTVVIQRAFGVPAHVLFEAWSKPEHVVRWFGPKDYPLTLCEMDFRVGGRYRFAMTGPDGQEMQPFGGEYLEIVPHHKLVYTCGFESPGAEQMTVTVTYAEQAGRTTLTHTTVFGSAAMKAEHLGMGYEQGIGSGFDQLDEVVHELARA